MAKLSVDRQILALTDEELERFTREWVESKKVYWRVQRFTGTGDLGRDIVGFETPQQHQSSWHNYQCKQYGRPLASSIGKLEIGKILYYSFKGEFSPPSAYLFVAPRGLNRSLRAMISKPAELKSELLATWDANCAKNIAEGRVIELTADLRAFIESWDFSNVRHIGVDEILEDPASKAVLKSWFDIDPGPAPIGVAPDEIEAHELPYVQQLIDAYGERDGCALSKDEVRAHGAHGEHFRRQRERFFDADSFTRFYRDNTMQEDIDVLRRNLHHGIAETHTADYADTLKRVDAVMIQAANIHPSGALAHHARVPVKQGICHHFANEGALTWRKG